MNLFLAAWKTSEVLPRSVSRATAAAGAWCVWVRRGKACLRLEDNLHRVTGAQGRQLRRLSRAGLASTARYYADVLEFSRITPAQIDARVRVIGVEDVHASLAADATVAIVLGHMANWDLVGAYTCRHIGKVTSVAEILEPREVFDKFVAVRELVGMRILGHEGSATFRSLISIAKSEGGVIALLADRDMSGSGLVVDFAGHKARVAPGPAALSLAVGCDLYPLAAYYERLHGARRRQAGSRWGIVMDIGPRIPVPQEGTRAEKVQAMSETWAQWLGEKVREHPEDWHMLQRFGWVD